MAAPTGRATDSCPADIAPARPAPTGGQTGRQARMPLSGDPQPDRNRVPDIARPGMALISLAETFRF